MTDLFHFIERRNEIYQRQREHAEESGKYTGIVKTDFCCPNIRINNIIVKEILLK